ncbi:MAG: LOG family protein, partial [Proteobacteria bacterium]|nr:LOG family protein [Pseudomonadota bacterium]
MAVEQKRVRKFLSKKIQQLNDIVADLDSLVTEIGSDFYRVSIFGSARIKPDTDEYKQVYALAKKLSQQRVDIVTGGGPGLMEAANLGSKDGGSQSRSFGLHIELPFESDSNSHLDVKYHHRRFSSRLDEFMR